VTISSPALLDPARSTPDVSEQRARIHLLPMLDTGVVPVLGGFMGSTPSGVTTTLGRGGADGTAAILGAVLGAEEIQIWTETAGMRPLADIITAAGLTIPAGYTLLNVLGASTDGSVVVGAAYDADGNAESFVLRLPVTAYGLAAR